MQKTSGFLSLLFLWAALGGCSTLNTKELAAGGLGELAGSQISYNPAQCKVIRDRCVQGEYSEWPTSDGQTGCSCQN